ncbi:hypothetical protein N3K66_002377 [Trichothecium roseum]|uniref:Uncharacterized protein n=1 Tax=Trichothecium roseum TaxID=47278 RepID=A0ACC0V9E9_9HYPO|nr:hypothetical protein N3K66_002377 [Trichothecium roseum]
MAEALIQIQSKQEFDSLLKSSRIVVADFYAEWCGPCKQIAPFFEQLASKVSHPKLISFAKINTDNLKDLTAEHSVSSLPTFLVFRDAKVVDKIQGADPQRLKSAIENLASTIRTLGESSASGSSQGGPWKGADIPKGYSDITDQIEAKGCELLNADEDAGPVKALFEDTKPSALDAKGKASTTKDYVQSGADDQLLLFIPFQSIVKLHTVQLTSVPPSDDDDAPARPGTIHFFINRSQNMDFSEADDSEPTQVVNLKPEDWNADGTANIGLRYVKFQKTTSLIVYVQQGDGEAETVRLDRIKLIGEAGAKREMGKLQKQEDEE